MPSDKKPWEEYKSDDPGVLAEQEKNKKLKAAIKLKTFFGPKKPKPQPKLTDILTDKESKRRKLGEAMGKYGKATEEAFLK